MAGPVSSLEMPLDDDGGQPAQTELPDELLREDENDIAKPVPEEVFFRRSDWVSFAATTLAVFAVYLCTIAPEITLEDGGAFVTAAAYAGVPDPPGLPVWTIYSWAFIKLLPFSNMAWRVTVGSAWAGAMACGLIALMVSRGGVLLLMDAPMFARHGRKEQNLLCAVAGCIAGLASGLCEEIWHDVALLHIWSISILLFACVLTLLMRWTASPQRKRYLYAACFVFGLLLTNSQFLVLFAPALVLWAAMVAPQGGRDLFLLAALSIFAVPEQLVFHFWLAFAPCAAFAIFTAIKTRRVGTQWLTTLLCGTFFIAGLSAYLFSALGSMANPPMNWGYPRTVEGFWHVVTRGQYDKLNPSRDVGAFFRQLVIVAGEIGPKLGWLYFVFIPLPFFFLRRASRIARQWLIGLVVALIYAGPAMVVMLNPSPDRQTLVLIGQYFSALYVVLAILAGLGIVIAGSVMGRNRQVRIQTPSKV